MMKYILFTLVAIFFWSCQEQGATGREEIARDSTYFEPNTEYVHMIPDSLRTAEQEALLDTLEKAIPKVLARNVVVENGHLVFKMTKEEFAETGIPLQYYDLIQKDLENNNAFLDTADLQQNIEEMWEDSYGQYR